jgi:hypothetical protein
LSGQTRKNSSAPATATAALLYLYVLRTGGALDIRDAAKTLNRSEAAVSSSWAFLGKLGLLKYDDSVAPPQKDELPEYTAEDIRRELDNGTVFASLVQEVQKLLGRILTSDDLIRLFGIYDNLGLPPEVIFQLISYCIYEFRKKYENHQERNRRMPSMRYIEKAAYTWEREGIFTLEQAEQYLKRLESKQSMTEDVKRCLQIRDRALSSGERKYIESWLDLLYPEMIEIAYDKTVLKTGRCVELYDSIITCWHQRACALCDILRKDVKGPLPQKAAPKKTAPAANGLADYERMKKYLEKLREE